VVQQAMAELIRQTQTQCVQRATLLGGVWAHAGEVRAALSGAGASEGPF
jgi:hypothetical protein